jgi:antitoxin component of MazEF toxin-antitoxin module
MVLQFAKWDDSVALCLPAEVAEQIHATEGGQVDLTIEGGKVVLTPVESCSYTLDQLLADMTEEHMHGEITTGRPVGNEVA